MECFIKTPLEETINLKVKLDKLIFKKKAPYQLIRCLRKTN